MMADDSLEILRRFEASRSEDDFRDLVRRHSPLVYATALRRLDGDRSAAEDVMQEVFTLLARKAGTLQSAPLPVWLHRQTCRRASNHLRTETRRRRRELASVQAMTDHHSCHDSSELLSAEIDEAMLGLPDSDREVLIRRYFEERDLRSVGGGLGISEDAARKRIDRALQKLAALLKRRGITVGATSLGGTMTGMGRTLVSEALVSQVTAHAIKSLPAAAWPALSLLKPFLSGVALSSLILGSSQAMLRRNEGNQFSTANSQAEALPSKSLRKPNIAPLPETPSLQSVIAELKRTNAGPRNELTTLRLRAILSRIRDEQIPDFVALANGALDEAERNAVYPMLVYRWMESDPDAAASFAILSDFRQQLDPSLRESLTGTLLNNWSGRGSIGMEDWLKQNWEQDALLDRPSESVGTLFSPWRLRESVAMRLVEDSLYGKGKEEMIRFLSSLPTPEDRIAALGCFSGKLYGRARTQSLPPEKQVKILKAIRAVPDERVREAAMADYLGSLARENPASFTGLMASLDPAGKFQASLQQLGIGEQNAEVEGIGDSSYTDQEALASPLEREQAVIDAGLAAGLTEAQARHQVAKVMIPALSREERKTWLDRHQAEGDFDEVLAATARAEATGRNGEIPVSPESAIELAARISDPDLRMRLARAAFRLLIEKDRPAAMDYPSGAGVPADLAGAFRNILGEAP